jgi:hypothetical protein
MQNIQAKEERKEEKAYLFVCGDGSSQNGRTTCKSSCPHPLIL